MATNPSVMSTWLTWLSTGPAKANVAAARMQAAVDSLSARRKTYIPTAMRREEDDLGGDPRGTIGQNDEQAGQGIEGAGVEVGHERRAAEDVLVPERQLAVPQHGADQDVEREVLLEIVSGDQQVPADEVREHEGGRGNGDQHDVGPQGSDVCSKSVHWRRDAFRGAWGVLPASTEAARSAQASPWLGEVLSGQRWCGEDARHGDAAPRLCSNRPPEPSAPVRGDGHRRGPLGMRRCVRWHA